MGFPRQEHWGGLPCPPPEHPPGPGVKPKSLTSLALTGRFFTTRATWEPQSFHSCSSDHRGRKYPPKMVTKEVVSFPSCEFFFLVKERCVAAFISIYEGHTGNKLLYFLPFYLIFIFSFFIPTTPPDQQRLVFHFTAHLHVLVSSVCNVLQQWHLLNMDPLGCSG